MDRVRFPEIADHPHREEIIAILDSDPQITSRKAGLDLEGEDTPERVQEEAPDEYAEYLLHVILSCEAQRSILMIIWVKPLTLGILTLRRRGC